MQVHFRRARFAVVGLTLAVVIGAAVANADVPRADIGNFYHAPDGPVISTFDCGADKLCGRVVGLGKLPPTDARNPDAALRARALCGLTVLTVTRANHPDTWNGTFYNPGNGTRYNVYLVLNQQGSFAVSGTVGELFVSRTFPLRQVWERAPATFAACAPSS